ncbi:MAG: UDP-N-acetylmuramate dehydrogenase [Eubacterium sp.]|jgi:UDP-N-acetylmuramate dehydrogenase|nr:UDP-N-acetylmuramate dehydrogenase [Eubacterium sp.]
MDFTVLNSIAEKYGSEIIFDCNLAQFTSFKIGGNSDVLIKINCEASLAETVKACKTHDIPYYVIGKGSNLLINDRGLRGAVLVISSDFSEITVNGDMIICDAGAALTKVCLAARDNSLTGLEFAYGIPGTVGGALYMNAGAYDGEMRDVIRSARFFDSYSGSIKEIFTDEMDLSYRHSVFMGGENVILDLCFKLKHGDKDDISSKMEKILKKRRDKQPLEYPSAGSTFKRPNGDFASRLIDECGLKGREEGGAQVSRKHSGFIINTGNASFDDVISLINIVKDEVYNKTGIMLECEVKIIC